MPQIFKALTSITAWTLFLTGWLALLSGYVRLLGIYSGTLAPAAGWPPAENAIISGAIFLALSAAVMKLRHMLE